MIILDYELNDEYIDFTMMSFLFFYIWKNTEKSGTLTNYFERRTHKKLSFKPRFENLTQDSSLICLPLTNKKCLQSNKIKFF